MNDDIRIIKILLKISDIQNSRRTPHAAWWLAHFNMPQANIDALVANGKVRRKYKRGRGKIEGNRADSSTLWSTVDANALMQLPIPNLEG